MIDDETQQPDDDEQDGEEEGGASVSVSEDDQPDVEDTEDGGAIIRLKDEGPAPGRSKFYDNLAVDMAEPDMNRISSSLLELVSRDKEARKKRDEQYEDGLRRTGLGDDAPGGAQFQGASRVVHPMLTEACVDFAARAMKELMPAPGPAKDFIPGEVTREKIKKAKRKVSFMNWQLTVQAPEFRAELEQLLTQVPLGGAQYLKLSWDEARNRPGFLFVAIDDMYLPFAATNFYTSQRRTHVQYLTQLDYEERVRSGMYRDVDLIPASAEPERSSADVANDKIEGRSETSYNEDGLRTIYEIYVTMSLDERGRDAAAEREKGKVSQEPPAPYIITIDKTSGKILSIYRNWDEDDDDSQEELQWFVEFPFVPWRGAYPIGLPHMIGGISAAATGALRALLDSAHISNSQTMLKLKGGSRGGQTLNIQPTQVEEIEGGLNVDDVRKIAMPLPFNPPSNVLYQLLGFLVDAGRGVVRTTMEDIADGNANAPVGTTLAKLEQGMVVFSAIHGRLHDAMGRVLRILHRLNGAYLDDEDVKRETGEEIATRADFEGPLDVVPVSDPNIFSETQRFAQVQAIAQRAAAMPQLYNQRKVEERILDTLKIPNPKDLLAPATEPREQNAVNENVTASMGKPIVAFPEQDHIAHLKTHLAYMVSPVFGANPLIAPSYLPAMLNHLREHIALWYASTVFNLSNEVAHLDIGEAMKRKMPPEEKRAFDRMLAEASQNVVQNGAEVFKALPPVIQQAQQMLQQLQPQTPQDPAAQAAMADTQQRAAAAQQRAQVETQKIQAAAAADQAQADIDRQRLQLDAQKIAGDQQMRQAGLAADAQADQAKLAMDAQKAQTDTQIEHDKLDAAMQRTTAEVASRNAMNTQDNMTALHIADLEAQTGERVGVSTGTGINPNP